MKKIKILSGATLKHIALFTMLCDHVNKAIFVNMSVAGAVPTAVMVLSACFDILGRIALPIFAFLLVEGFFNTRSRGKYLRNLLVFAVISEIPFNMFTGGELLIDWHQNIYFTLALGFGMIWLIDVIKRRTKLWLLPAVPIIGVACLVSMFGSFDYDFFGILTIALFYLLRGRWFCPAVAFLPLVKTPWAGLGYLATYLYNGERGKQCKWFNYWFYPAHLLVIGIIRMVFFN